MRNLHMVAGYSKKIMRLVKRLDFDWKSGKGVGAARNYYFTEKRFLGYPEQSEGIYI